MIYNNAEKDRLRAELRQDVESFLSSGGKITECEPRKDQRLKIKNWISKLTWKLRVEQLEHQKKQESI